MLVIGGRAGCDYAHLRDTLDAALANRLPNVELVTAGGPGVPAPDLTCESWVSPRLQPSTPIGYWVWFYGSLNPR